MQTLIAGSDAAHRYEVWSLEFWSFGVLEFRVLELGVGRDCRGDAKRRPVKGNRVKAVGRGMDRWRKRLCLRSADSGKHCGLPHRLVGAGCGYYVPPWA